MQASDYARFVHQSDWTVDRRAVARNRILRYGLVGEIGSVIAAIKKRLLAEEGVERRFRPDDGIGEELGDLLWYCFALYGFEHPHAERNALTSALSCLRDDLAVDGPRSERIREWLGARDWVEFQERSGRLITEADLSFDDYQKVAFLTARTTDNELVEVCLAVLTQLGAELLRSYLPPIEKELNRTLPDRRTDVVLGEVIWHVSALAELFGLQLGDVVETNRRKLLFRLDRTQRTPLHDADAPQDEQLPRQFEIEIVGLGDGRSRMMWNSQPLGDDLTDNARDADGYRFHDAMHIAHAAKLGWSPVLRSLMGAKRKHDPEIDEVEDGARAKIVEEAVIKIVHSEGVRVARERGSDTGPLFIDRAEIGFSFLKLVRSMVAGLEAERNRDWEWEDAILAGHRVFDALRQHQQGKLIVDMHQRSIAFDPGYTSAKIDRFVA